MPFDPLRRKTAAGLAAPPEVTQGALIGGLRLPRYGDGSYYGFLITARCDLAHVRTDTVNALPVVPLREWLMFDGCISAVFSRLLNLESRLEELGESLPGPLGDLVRQDWAAGYGLFVVDNADVDKDLKERIRAALEEYTEFRGVLASCDSPQGVVKALASSIRFRELIERDREKKIAALIENRVLDAHFLPIVRNNEPLSEGPGYVIMFRQILSIPGLLLDPIKHGLRDFDGVPETLRAQAREHLVCPCEIVGNVASPHVEHVLQRFSNVFGRVGVADSSKRYREWLIKTTSEAFKR